MVEAILLQIPPPVREAFWVHTAYHHNCIMYAEHVFLHSLILPLLNLIQSPYHGIIVVLVTKCLLHVHQQIPHGDILALIQCVGPFARVPTETGKNVRVHAGLIILLKKGIHIEVPVRVCHSAPGSVNLKISISNLTGTSHFFSLLLLWLLHLCWQLAVSLTVEYPSESSAPLSREEGGTPSAHCSALGLRWSSARLRSLCMGGEPSLSHLFHPGGSSSLLWCTSHQLAQGVGPPCSYNWNIMDWVLSPTPQPLVVRGSN